MILLLCSFRNFMLLNMPNALGGFLMLGFKLLKCNAFLNCIGNIQLKRSEIYSYNR
jgi:hypothetical protein